MKVHKKVVSIGYAGQSIDINDLSNAAWEHVPKTNVPTYWSGAIAPAGRHFSFKMLWSDDGLYIRFLARVDEPLVASNAPDLNKKTIGLWDRDVCEVFVAPDPSEPCRYFEFEVAPTGEWLDVALDSTGGERISDWEYNSGMKTASRIEDDHIITMMQIPFASLGKTPKPDDVWLGNIFRCVGKDPTRGYLAWSPTMTETPNFHVPERFGEFRFV